MIESIVIAFASLEIGTWLGFAAAKVTEPKSGVLLTGFDNTKRTPFVDDFARKQTMHTTSMDKRMANAVTRGLRHLINRDAFEIGLAGIINMGRNYKTELDQPVVRVFV